MSNEVQYLVCGEKQVRIPANPTPNQVHLSHKRLAWMVNHNGFPFPAELDRQLRDNGLTRRNKGKKNKKEKEAIINEVSAEALFLIEQGNSIDR